MKKAFGRAALVLFLLFFCVLQPAKALAADDHPVLLVDEADLVASWEEEMVLAALERVSARYGVDVAVLTVNTMNGESAMDFADSALWLRGYGQGEDRNAILLVIDMETRSYYESTHGAKALYAFTDYGLESYLEPAFLGALSRGDYAGAFTKYAEACDYLMGLAEQGQPYDIWIPDPQPSLSELITAGDWKEVWAVFKDQIATTGFFSAVIGFIAALIRTGSMKKQLKSVEPNNNASDYVRDGSFYLTEDEDAFLYRTVTKTRRPQYDERTGGSSGGHYGGSSTHSGSSGGGSFGGHGGHF